MSTRPISHSSENTKSDHNQEKPQFALAIGFLPPGLPAHLIPNWGIKPASCADELGNYGPGQALAIGPSGPPIRPLSEAELAAQANAINFNPYHDALGRFTDSEGAAGGRSDSADGEGRANPNKGKSSEEYKVLYPVTVGAFAQKTKTSECAAAAAREIVAQIARLRAARGESMPEGTVDTLRGIESYINEHRTNNGQAPIDFSSYRPGVGATVGDAKAVLEEKFKVQTQLIPIDQIPDKLKQGPVLVAVGPSTNAHAEVILGVAGPQSYYVYNPLIGNRVGTISASEITIAEGKDKSGKITTRTPVVYATRPGK